MQLEELSNVNINLYEFAKNIVKYQNFKTQIALNLFNYHISKITATNYFNLGITYLKTKIKSKSIPNKIYEYIDDAIDKHIQPLTPKESEKRRVYKKIFAKKEAILPIQETLKEIQYKNMTEKFEYGVMYDDTIKVFGTDETKAKIFLAGIKFVGKQGRLVSIQDIKEN